MFKKPDSRSLQKKRDNFVVVWDLFMLLRIVSSLFFQWWLAQPRALAIATPRKWPRVEWTFALSPGTRRDSKRWPRKLVRNQGDNTVDLKIYRALQIGKSKKISNCKFRRNSWHSARAEISRETTLLTGCYFFIIFFLPANPRGIT